MKNLILLAVIVFGIAVQGWSQETSKSGDENELTWINVKSTLWLNENVFFDKELIRLRKKIKKGYATNSLKWNEIKDIVMTQEEYNHVITIVGKKTLETKGKHWKQDVIRLIFKRNVSKSERDMMLSKIQSFAKARGAVLIGQQEEK